MEMKWENVHFTRVDADIADNLIDKSDAVESLLGQEEQEKLKQLFAYPSGASERDRGSKRIEHRSSSCCGYPAGIHATHEGHVRDEWRDG